MTSLTQQVNKEIMFIHFVFLGLSGIYFLKYAPPPQFLTATPTLFCNADILLTYQNVHQESHEVLWKRLTAETSHHFLRHFRGEAFPQHPFFTTSVFQEGKQTTLKSIADFVSFSFNICSTYLGNKKLGVPAVKRVIKKIST